MIQHGTFKGPRQHQSLQRTTPASPTSSSPRPPLPQQHHQHRPPQRFSAQGGTHCLLRLCQNHPISHSYLPRGAQPSRHRRPRDHSGRCARTVLRFPKTSGDRRRGQLRNHQIRLSGRLRGPRQLLHRSAASNPSDEDPATSSSSTAARKPLMPPTDILLQLPRRVSQQVQPRGLQSHHGHVRRDTHRLPHQQEVSLRARRHLLRTQNTRRHQKDRSLPLNPQGWTLLRPHVGRPCRQQEWLLRKPNQAQRRAWLQLLLRVRTRQGIFRTQQGHIDNPSARSTGGRIQNVQVVGGGQVSCSHHHFQCPQLLRLLQQQRRSHQVRKQHPQHPAVCLKSPPLPAPQLHEPLHMEHPICFRKVQRNSLPPHQARSQLQLH